MNPLYFAGPRFLAFYAALTVVVFVVLYLLRSVREGGNPPRIDASDPYLIAYLRGGWQEAARIAVVTLSERGLLKVHDETLAAAAGADLVHRPIERAVLALFQTRRDATEMFKSQAIAAACTEYHSGLTRLGLLPDEEIRRERLVLLMVALLVLVGTALAKIIIAVKTGHSNIVFLLVLAILFPGLAILFYARFRTVRGDSMLASLRRLYARLKARAGSLAPGAVTEMALLAAVFGIGALSARFNWAKELFARARDRGGSCGGGCGSGCGGGGGGGGGCGGCGGGGCGGG